MSEIDWEQFEKDMKERMHIEATHSWIYRCFPPGPTTCTMCGANRSDPDLRECDYCLTLGPELSHH